MTRRQVSQEEYYAGVRMVPYDLLKELTIALGVILVLMLALAAAFSSPDVPPVTVQSWAPSNPVDLVTTATGELAGTTDNAGYGAPYNNGDGSVQSLGPISPQAWGGVHLNVNTANDFVLGPLQTASTGNPQLTAALQQYNAATDKQRGGWLDAYTKALGDAKAVNGEVTVADGDYGPLPVMMTNLVQVARTGGLDANLLNSGHFYETDFTRPLLFMNDGSYLSDLAHEQKLEGDQWGMMNETGQYPGQTWLWLYTVWYQLPQFQDGGVFGSNADLVVVALMVVLTALLALVPFIPGLRDIPRWTGVHRLIWRRPSSPSTKPRPAASSPAH